MEFVDSRTIGTAHPSDQAPAPLISVLIRSMDRPMLQDALASVAIQDYPNVEVIVINACGLSHQPLGENCGPFSLRFVGTEAPMRRSRAANHGLANARGDYLLFLDDDDWLESNHLRLLYTAIQNNPDRQVAYSNVEVRGICREPLGLEPFNSPFDPVRLRSGNYIPIHALLFSNSLVSSENLRFDEELDVYEDWDFVLQLSQLSGFTHVNAVSAYYRASGTSGVGVAGNEVDKRRARGTIYDKWKIRWTGQEIAEMVANLSNTRDDLIGTLRNELTSEIRNRDLALSTLNSKVDQLDRRLIERTRTIDIKNHEIEVLTLQNAELTSRLSVSEKLVHESGARVDQILKSTSWRISAPIRFAGDSFSRLKQMIRSLLMSMTGLRVWPPGSPTRSQGFSGEPLVPPTGSPIEPLISVIMPVYNACRAERRHFWSALRSIEAQTYKNFELIVVDDGSTDDTRIVYEEFARSHPELRTRYLYKANEGQSSARNFGVQASNGEYIGFIDQDDEWYVDKLEKMVPWLANKAIDVLYTDADTIDGNDAMMHQSIHQTHCLGWPHPKKSIEDILFKDIFVMPGLMLVKRQVFDKISGFDHQLSGYEDDDLFLRLFQTGKIFYLPISTLRWRMHGDNYSSSRRMLTSRLYYWRKLIRNYTCDRQDRFRVHMISARFFHEFLAQSVQQFNAGNELYRESLAGAREIAPYMPTFPRLLYSLAFLSPDRFLVMTVARARRLVHALG